MSTIDVANYIFAMLMTTSVAFTMDSNGIYSYLPWKLWPPAKIFGQGNPLKERFAPSVPPRIGCTFGVMPASSMAFMARSTT